jgi:hypothetical protein
LADVVHCWMTVLAQCREHAKREIHSLSRRCAHRHASGLQFILPPAIQAGAIGHLTEAQALRLPALEAFLQYDTPTTPRAAKRRHLFRATAPVRRPHG